MQHSYPFTITNRFRSLLPVPGVTSYGAWEEYTWDNSGTLQYGAQLVPQSAGWRDLFEALDVEGQVESAAPVSLLDEVDAIVACCWRYGSYVHVLTAGESYPAFRTDSRLSRISDAEMMRVNLEFSSGLAAWLSDRVSDLEKINRRVRAASHLLHMPWRANRQEWLQQAIVEHGDEVLETLRAQAPIWHEYDEPPNLSVRGEANLIVNHAYRNGPIEDLHAGKWNHGTEIPGFQRLYADEIERVSRTTVERLALMLRLRDLSASALGWLPLPFRPKGWSETAETTTLRYPGLPEVGPLRDRLRSLARRYPALYAHCRLLSALLITAASALREAS
jgi:hypothetical protein